MKKKIGGVIILSLVIMQFFGIDKSTPEYDKSKDLLTVTQAPTEVAELLKEACYDCHSNETRYPWYTSVAPVSWWIAGHIKNARENSNYSTWGTWSADKRQHKAEESAEEIETGHMPPKSFRFMHSGAKLTDEQKTMLADWFRSLK